MIYSIDQNVVHVIEHKPDGLWNKEPFGTEKVIKKNSVSYCFDPGEHTPA